MNPSLKMAFRGGNRNRNFGGNYGGGQMGGGNRNMNPWDNQSVGNYGGGNMRQGGGGGPGPMNAEALSLANNLLNNLLRNQNPPSLLDLPRGGGGAGGMGGPRGPRGQMGNRAVGGGGNRNNRRTQGGFARGGQKQGSINKQGGGIRKQNAFDRAKKLLAKNSNKKKDSTSGENTEISKKESIKESPYADVPNDMFYCHLCKKHMWDANSFENHIKGRTHLMMREGIEESYRLKANMIRQEAKIAEQLKTIELDRLKRMGKSGKNRNLEYCTMCDLNFHGHLSAHRKSDGHLQLKKFLHPKCNECNKEFPTRIEFDTHLLSSEHLKKCAEKNTKVGERKKNTLQILTEEDELKDVRPPQKKKKKAPVAEKKEGEEGEKWEGVEIKKENGEDEMDSEIKKEEPMDDSIADDTKEGLDLDEIKEEDEPAELPVDPEDCILDFNDGDEIPSEVDAKLPKYNWTRPVGSTLISRLECYECSICGKFFDTDKTAEIHSRTASHHRQFLKFINDKSSDTKIAQKRAAAAIEETERKRKRLEEAEAAKEAENNGEEKATGDLYDPSQATGEDEDVEMNQGEGQQANGNEKTDDMNGDEFKDAGDDDEEDEDEEEDEEEDYGTGAGGTSDEQKMDVQEVVQPEPAKEEPIEIKPVVVEAPVVTKQPPVVTPAPAAQPILQQQQQQQPQQQQPPLQQQQQQQPQQQQPQQQQQQPQQQQQQQQPPLQQQQQQPQHQQQQQPQHQQQQQQQTQVPQSPVIAANSPQKKQTPARGAGAKGKPGSRGRGRYNRY